MAHDPLASWDPLKDVELLTDPAAVTLIAQQLNDRQLNQNVAQNAPVIKNLSEAIQDIVINTTAQGAGTLVVSIIDPYWALTKRWTDAPAFIDIDDSGLLIPVDVNFPQSTDMWWRLCAADPSFDTAGANLILTFEDRIATELRDHGGPEVASGTETRAAFIARMVKKVPEIKFVCPALSQPAGSVGGNQTLAQINAALNPLPKSATNPKAPTARKNPSKKPGIGNPTQGATWVPGVGWRYTKSINGLSPKVLDILNPPTNQPDGGPPGAFGGLGFTGF